MSYIGTSEYLAEVSKGNVSGASIIHKFGKNLTVGTSYIPVSIGGIYETPQAASATTLRIKSGGNVNDTAAGTGAQKVMIEGIDASGNVVSEELTTAGASASSVSSNSYIRLYRFYVSESGSYANASGGSHAGNIVIENGAGGTDWGEIDSSGFAISQSEIGAFTIPSGYTGYLLSALGFSDSTKTTELIFFKREGILDAAAPYEAMRILFEERLEGGAFTVNPAAPILIGTSCDCGFLAKVNTSTALVEVDFEILLIQN